MPTDEPSGAVNERRRQEAKSKLDNWLAQQGVRARRRRVVGIGAAVVAVLVVAVGGVYFTTEDKSSAEPAGQPAAAPHTSGGPCAYTSNPEQPAAKPIGLPPDPNPTPHQGTEQLTLRTNQGTIPLAIDRAKAPCTAQNFEHLAKGGFFDGTNCHRIANDPKMLQCGDPTGSGSGGPGYSFRDETHPDLTYPRGTLAMANSGPNTNGSQFFLVYGDAPLPPNYTVFGTVDQSGLQVIDKVAAAGSDNSSGPGDGKPVLPVHIDGVTAA